MRYKILHILPSFGIGGAEKLVLNLLSKYDKDQFEIEVVCLHSRMNTIYESELDRIGAKVIYLDKKSGLNIGTIFNLNTLFRKIKPDVIHTHLYTTKYALIPAFLNRIKVRVHTVHSIAEKELNRRDIIIQKLAYRSFGFIPIAISDIVKKSIKTVYKFEAAPVIYNGVEVSKYYHVDNTDNDIIRLINVGRFSKVKNHKLLIDAIRLVAVTHKNIKLTLVGDGEERKSIEDLVDRYDLKEIVCFLGVREDIPKLLADSDIFIMSSNWEGLSLAIIEAMASGLPIISTDVGGMSEIVHNDKNGLLVESQDEQGLADAICLLVENYELRKMMSKESKQLSGKYDIENTNNKYQELYRKLINEAMTQN
ncbi:glycosyltransferase [Youngiibacter multivorans]|uniref:Glycosyltransferase involved in cell wall biosynthesis n=1 Tax=Youngiibacter multivorans TaxID=937251 RepID=A0ABS4G3B6_9CLOT|nr:glycosyltransferase [Youngiibacter multivorans]MBP1919011.1 glycosyltransferase involved in cell wall biosynthesis [Youngiibacter multivorans]